MKRYQFLLFDADGTLLDFDRCEEKALRDTLLFYGISDCGETIACYHQINAALWERFNCGEIDRPYLLRRRFEQLCEQLGCSEDPERMNRYYMEQLSQHADLLEESAEICNILHKKYKLYITLPACRPQGAGRGRRHSAVPTPAPARARPKKAGQTA